MSDLFDWEMFVFVTVFVLVWYLIITAIEGGYFDRK